MSSSLPKVLLIKFYQLQKNIMTTHRVPTVFSQELHQFYIDSLQVLVVICIGITSFRGYIQQAYMCPGSLAITFRNRSSYNQSISSPPPPPIQDTQHYQATVISSRSSNTSPTSICHLKGRMLFTGITRNSMESRFPEKPHSIINLEHSILLGILRLDIRSIPPAPPRQRVLKRITILPHACAIGEILQGKLAICAQINFPSSQPIFNQLFSSRIH